MSETSATVGRSAAAGAGAIAPILLGIVPFGLVAGVAAVEAGVGTVGAVAASTLIFAGASQLAALDLLGAGAPGGVVVLTVLVINLRMAMYSAALAPWFAGRPAGERSLVAYLLTDQAFAVSVARFTDPARPTVHRTAFYLGAALTLWGAWQVATVTGAQLGAAIPAGVPLGFAVPLAFIALVVPTVTDRPTLVAALVGGSVAVAAAPLPTDLGMPLGAVCGVLAGVACTRAGAVRRASRSGP